MNLPAIRSGMRLGRFKGLLRGRQANILQSVSNAVLNIQITEGDSNKVMITENNMVIQIIRR